MMGFGDLKKFTEYLNVGKTSEEVKLLQNTLGCTVTSKFDKETENCVKEFQKFTNIRVDGIVGPETRGKLNDMLSGKIKGWLGCKKTVKIQPNDNNPNQKSCKHCMKSYPNPIMSQCAYQAIERFEENYGRANGTSMGDYYFEGTYKAFNSRINSRINKVIGSSAWNSMSEKFKMQLWSFMFNSDSGVVDKYRWLAVLYLVANPNIKGFDKSITSRIINKKDINEWDKARKLVSNTSNWDLDKFLTMLDGQYSTYGNEGAYEKSWSFRPKYLNTMYDECVSKQ